MSFRHAVILLLDCQRFNEYFRPSFPKFYLMLHLIILYIFIKRLPANHGAQLNIMVLFSKISILFSKYFKISSTNYVKNYDTFVKQPTLIVRYIETRLRPLRCKRPKKNNNTKFFEEIMYLKQCSARLILCIIIYLFFTYQLGLTAKPIYLLPLFFTIVSLKKDNWNIHSDICCIAIQNILYRPII